MESATKTLGWWPAVERVYVILDHLPAHRTTDVLLFALSHPRFEFVFQPQDAAYLTLIEPWWNILLSFGLKGCRLSDLGGDPRSGRGSDVLQYLCQKAPRLYAGEAWPVASPTNEGR